jgi:hypothetical protein
MEKKIYGFYLVVTINDWREVFLEQINSIINSDLFKKTDKLFIRVYHIQNDDLIFVKNKVEDYSNVEVSHTQVNEFEFGILGMIQDLSINENFYCYYLHTKGVSITKDNMFKYHKSTDLTVLKNNIESWRRYMEYFLIDKFQDNIGNLSIGYDACGVQYTTNPVQHFSGNFWWSKSEYIKTLPKIISIDKTKRHNAEYWIGRGNGKLISLYQTSQAGYRQTVKDNYRI